MTYWKSLAAGLLVFCLGAFFFGIKVSAQGLEPLEQWVIDPESILSFDSTAHLKLMLAETAAKQGIYIRVFVINDESTKSFAEQCDETIQTWEAANFYKRSNQNWGYIVINTHSAQGKVWLNAKNVHSHYLATGLHNLETHGITPALLEGDLEKAILQGVVGLSTILKEPPMVKPPGSIEKLIALYHTSALFHFFVLIIIFGLIGAGIVIYLRSPVTPREPDLETSLN